MIPLFKNVGLVGIGLIGGSLARAMKKHNIAGKITGYAKSPESLYTAIRLGVIDNIASSVADMAEVCDIIIICTPLSTYENIFKEIAKIIQGRDCIISDVGSLKSFTLGLSEKYLTEKNRKLFIPAHPIAGTEKTGVESGFAELFNGKKTILTPAPDASGEAIEKVSRLWNSCGSNTEIMDADQHDKIYAEVSHLPQFLAYCYASLLKDNANQPFDVSEEFWKFSRICASDPVIWMDIFAMNKDNLLIYLNIFINELKNKLSINGDDNFLYKTLPAIISQLLIKCSPDKDYAGSGFKDFTSYPIIEAGIVQIYDDILVNGFIKKTTELSGYFKDNSLDEALGFMGGAASWYRFFREGTN